jgi:adrenodoxin-NADP+ reductase
LVGHPHYDHIGDTIVQILEKKKKQINNGNHDNTSMNVVIVGHGNVALDCARILAKGGTKPISSSSSNAITITNDLYHTDISKRAWDVLQQYPFWNIVIIGRRGHVQASFTIKELRELVRLEDDGYNVPFIVRNDELDMCTSTIASQEELSGPYGRPKLRIDTLLREAASKGNDSLCSIYDDYAHIYSLALNIFYCIVSKACNERQVQLRFLVNPIGLVASTTDPTSLCGVVCERNTLIGDAGTQRAVGTGEYETIPACLVLVSIGYKGLPLPGIEQWFDTDHGTIRNDHGRVDGKTETFGALYTSGWIKRGPTGIIGTNITDARETVATITADIKRWVVSHRRNNHNVDLYKILKQRGVQVVDWQGYCRIEERERSLRRSEIQPREKLVTLEDQLAAAFSL